MTANYHIKSTNRTSQFIQIELFINIKKPQTLYLQIPAWRPGRYQLADYAKNIRSFIAKDTEGNVIPIEKTQKNQWKILVTKASLLVISYEYYSAKMDAGSCWVDEEQIYLNFVNCCMEVISLPNLEYKLHLEYPADFTSMSTLPKNTKGEYLPIPYQRLADSTFIAASRLTHWTYEVDVTKFHCWFHGTIHFDRKNFLDSFQKFTRKQLEDFGEFPEKEYHFIFQLLPYPHYHGVEHQRGTVITFGPAESLTDELQLEELLGVSSHELYHAWNVCRIRPIELLPYDFSKETFTQAGWMLEGITTYMGDLYLLKSGVYSFESYLKHLNHTVNRAFRNLGWQNYSVLESSFDLWLDGYENGIPERKVNIYAHGSVIALCLDLILLKSNQSSLKEVMRKAWLKFGKPSKGYTAKSFWQLFLKSVDDTSELVEFYQNFIAGHEDIFEQLKTLLPVIGLELTEDYESNPLEASLGLILSDKKITRIHPDSPAFVRLMIGDELNFQITGNRIEIQAKRINGTISIHHFKVEKHSYFPNLIINPIQQLSFRKKWME